MDLAHVLKALSHSTRLSIFDMLMEGVQCNCEIAERLELSLNLISYHMRTLQDAGLVRSERDQSDARWIYYTIDPIVLEEFRTSISVLLDPSRIKPRVPSCGPRRCCSC